MEFRWHETLKQVNILNDTLKYSFVRETYPMTWPEISNYAMGQLYSDPRHKYDDYANFLVPRFQKIAQVGIADLLDLALHCINQEAIIATAERCEMPVEELDRVLYYLTYWMLPRNFYLRDVIQKGDKEIGNYCAVLRKCGYPNSLDLLESARTRSGREQISAVTGVPFAVLTQLVHRADFTRVGCGPNMVNMYINSGFETVEKLVHSDLNDLTEKVTYYMASLGKVPKYGVDLPAHHAVVRLAPMVVEG